MNVRPFKWWDLDRFIWQPVQEEHRDLVTVDYARGLEDIGPAYTFEHDSRIVACAGFVPHGSAAQLWAFLSPTCPMVTMTRAAERSFHAHEFRDLWALCDWEFEAGRRWLRLLGFRLQKRLDEFYPARCPQALYTRDLWATS